MNPKTRDNYTSPLTEALSIGLGVILCLGTSRRRPGKKVWSMRFFRSSRRDRLFILGLDGSPLPLLRQLMQAGDLPNLARVFETGSAIEMDSSLPDVSAVAWTSINTGVNPGKHGIYGFVDRKPGTQHLDVMTSTHVRVPTLWERMSDAGKRAIAINVPLSYPPQHINGLVISDFLAPALAKAVYPTQALPYLENLGYRIDTDPRVARESLEAFVEDFKITAEKRAEAVLHFMAEEEWDVFMVVFMETDRLHHFMWQYMEEGDPTYGPQFVDCYRRIDRLAGRILDQLEADDQLIILSDHGFTTLKREVYLNVWLDQQGYLRLQGGGDRELEGICPETVAYSLDPGRVYLNLQGREPAGTVSPSDVPGIIERLVEELSDLRDPESGESMVETVHRADDIYHGPERERAPDLLVMGRDGYDIKGTFDATELTGRGKLVGMHKYSNATLFVRGREFTVDHATVRDVLPTAYRLLQLPDPDGFDGKGIIRG